ncbi:C4-dicarboxylate ABC transporter [Tenacibaculum sp. KUL152]|nr:C4-dicarboxylate ABC transporter [Tenacibaculum sp. KUL152]GFD94509.1 C4-dicarboxylate ABC transporter [Alteromonas sp. KUL154]GFD97522.1 C4-dicarboxylate ABC transporter [Alteromonas sp. KUL156]
MKTLAEIIPALNKALRTLLATMMALLVLNVTWQVITRFILPHPSSFTEELARFFLIWISLLGSAYAFHTHSHLGFDYLTKKMQRNAAVTTAKLGYVLVILFALGVLLIGGVNLTYITFLLNQESPVLGIPMGYVYLVVPISGLLFIIYGFLGLLEMKDANNLREHAL